jgi:uncharacterized protein (TIGR00369 family)
MTDDDAWRAAAAIFAAQPFSTFIGATLVLASAESTVIRLPVNDHHRQQHGLVHGGVLSYLADNALTFAGGLALGGDAVTLEFKINYVRPAKGSAVIARASAVCAGKTQAVCRCDLFSVTDDVETLCALAQGTIMKVLK